MSKSDYHYFESSIDPNDMTAKEKIEMLSIMERYRTDTSYRKKINNYTESELNELEKMALRGMLVSDNGVEIIASDLSNYYDDYNIINLENEAGIITTCMNMAISEMIHEVFLETNRKKYPELPLKEIKTRMKGRLFNKLDKEIIIQFIQNYHHNYPNYLAKKAKKFYDIYKSSKKQNMIYVFKNLAITFNSNIYLEELVHTRKRNIYHNRRKKF